MNDSPNAPPDIDELLRLAEVFRANRVAESLTASITAMETVQTYMGSPVSHPMHVFIHESPKDALSA